MRYIDLHEIEPLLPEGWQKRAQQALHEVENLLPDERLKEIDKRASIWQEIKDVLAEYSHSKCWYCESRQDRSDNDVDHFRPKGRVAECQEHKGYWWLAFNWMNYRFSCTYCNRRRRDRVTGHSGGKQDHFPLLDEENRACCREDDLEVEQPCLLDPTDEADPGLLWFNQYGEAVPRYDEQRHLRLYQRARMSIELYHLNLGKTRTRRMVLYTYIERLVGSGGRYFTKYASGDQDMEYAFKEIIKDLRATLDKKAEFSAAARAYLSGFRSSEHEWLEVVFTTW